MDSSRRRPSLPPLETNIPLPERQATSVPAPPKPTSLKNIPVIPVIPEIPLRKKAETPVTPTLSPQAGGEENIRPLSGSASCGYGVSFKPLVIDSSAPRTKTDYYNDAFTFRGSPTSPQERVTRDSIMVAELKTNIQSKLEGFKLAYDIAFRLARIYQRPISSIMVTTEQDACLFFHASLPAYLLKIYALPSFIAPVTNKRNTNFIQAALLELLHISPDHGVVIFLPVPEENLGINGTTTRGEISRLERSEQGDSPNIFKTLSRSMSRRLKSSSGNSAPMSPSDFLPPVPTPEQPVPTPEQRIPTTGQRVPTPGQWADDERGRRLTQLSRTGSMGSIVRRRLLAAIQRNKETDKEREKEMKEKLKERVRERLKEQEKEIKEKEKAKKAKKKESKEDTKKG